MSGRDFGRRLLADLDAAARRARDEEEALLDADSESLRPIPTYKTPDYIEAVEAAGGRVYTTKGFGYRMQLGPRFVCERLYETPRWCRIDYATPDDALAVASGSAYPDSIASSYHATVWDALDLPRPADAGVSGL